MPTTYTGGGYPNWLVGEYPGLEGISTALKGFGALMKNPGYNQLTASAASDPGAGQYQGATEGGAPLGAGAGLFGRLMAGNYGADVQGQAAQQQGQTNAAQGKVQAGQAAGSLMAGQQEANLGLEQAKNQQSLQELGGFEGILNMLTNPKGMGANITGLFTGSNTSSPLGLLGGLFGGKGTDPTALLSSGASPSELGSIADITGTGAGAGLEDWLTTALGAGIGA